MTLHGRFAALSSEGGRERNEDAQGAARSGESSCWVVADGLGGHRGGAEASQVVVQAVLRSFRAYPTVSPARVQQHLEAAQEAILALQERDERIASCRSTAVVLVASGQRLCWGHVGDSRLLWFRAGELIFRTTDHSVAQARVDAGELEAGEIRGHPARNQLLQTLGNVDRLAISLGPDDAQLEPGDAVLLCSDGFWDLVPESDMATGLREARNPDDWLERMRALLAARAESGHDNWSATAIWFGDRDGRLSRPEPRRRWLTVAGVGLLALGVLAGAYCTGLPSGDALEAAPAREP